MRLYGRQDKKYRLSRSVITALEVVLRTTLKYVQVLIIPSRDDAILKRCSRTYAEYKVQVGIIENVHVHDKLIKSRITLHNFHFRIHNNYKKQW